MVLDGRGRSGGVTVGEERGWQVMMICRDRITKERGKKKSECVDNGR